MDIPILYEDEDTIVINKPAGLVVNRSETVSGETVQDWAEKKLGLTAPGSTSLKTLRVKDFQPSAFLSRCGIVHRLDKETSGCLIVAKNPDTFLDVQKQFKDRAIKKEYLALVHGRVEPNEGTIRVPLARSRRDRQKFSVSPGGRSAETRYVVEHRYIRRNEPLTLVRLFPKTGRTHQIRVHMSYFGHPLVADLTYGGKKRSDEDRVWCPRMFLHAAAIEFMHPNAHARTHVDAQPPSDLTAVLSSL